MSKPKFTVGNTASPIDFRNDAEMVILGLRPPLKQPYIREVLNEVEKVELKQAKLSYKAAVKSKNPRLKQLHNEMLFTIVNTKRITMNLTLKPLNYN